MKKGDTVYAAINTRLGYRVIPGVILNTDGHSVTSVGYPIYALDPETDDRAGKGYWSPGAGGEPIVWMDRPDAAVTACREHIIAKHTAAAKKDCDRLAKAVFAGELPAGFTKPERAAVYG